MLWCVLNCCYEMIWKIFLRFETTYVFSTMNSYRCSCSYSYKLIQKNFILFHFNLNDNLQFDSRNVNFAINKSNLLWDGRISEIHTVSHSSDVQLFSINQSNSSTKLDISVHKPFNNLCFLKVRSIEISCHASAFWFHWVCNKTFLFLTNE